jgi:hypothetical protein
MDIIIPNIKRYSDGEIDRAFMREIKNGFKLEKATEQKRYNQAVKEAAQLAREFFRLTSKYGHEEVHSKEFLKDYNKRFPELSPNEI